MFIIAFVFLTRVANAATLIGYWPFEEISGSIVNDQSDNGNNGQLTGATHSAGKVGNGLSFDGSGGVTIPNSPSLDSLPDGFTMEAWILATAFPLNNSDFGTIFFKTDRNNPVNVLHFQVGDSVTTTVGRLYAAMNGNANQGLGWQGFGPRTIGFGEWHFVVWTYDNQFERFYDDGIQVLSEPFTDPWLGNHEVLQIGQHRQLPLNANFYGNIDEARIYNGALTQDEILHDMNPSAIPEPSSFILLLLSFSSLMFRRFQ